jgi:hypothetical protein
LWKQGRLDLTAEFYVVQDRFRSLFTPSQTDLARWSAGEMAIKKAPGTVFFDLVRMRGYLKTTSERRNVKPGPGGNRKCLAARGRNPDFGSKHVTSEMFQAS